MALELIYSLLGICHPFGNKNCLENLKRINKKLIKKGYIT